MLRQLGTRCGGFNGLVARPGSLAPDGARVGLSAAETEPARWGYLWRPKSKERNGPP
jgi:hypothetical protein